jgi:phosphonate transport system substrate-binding protein
MDVGRKEAFVLRPSYADVRRELERGEIDVAFVCTGTYVHARRSGLVDLLVRPEFENGMEYRSYLIVPAHSSRDSVEELRGATMAYTDPESNTGCLVPRALLAKHRLRESFFERIVFSGSHDKSIQAVAIGAVDVAAVDSLVWESSVKSDPSLEGKTRVIWRSEPFGAPPVVVPSSIDPELKEALRRAFLGLDGDEEGRKVLSSIGIARFVGARDDEYRTAAAQLDMLTKNRPGGP